MTDEQWDSGGRLMGTILLGPPHPAALKLMRELHPTLFEQDTWDQLWDRAWATLTPDQMRTLVEGSTVDPEDHDYQGDGTSRCCVCLGSMNEHIHQAAAGADCASGQGRPLSEQRYEIEAWLGDTWTPEQKASLIGQIEAFSGAATEADWIAVCQSYDGTLDVAALGDDYWRASVAAEAARLALYAGIRQAAKTTSESEIARVAGVTRMTIHKALGK
jgi:hypothetical protein